MTEKKTAKPPSKRKGPAKSTSKATPKAGAKKEEPKEEKEEGLDNSPEAQNSRAVTQATKLQEIMSREWVTINKIRKKTTLSHEQASGMVGWLLTFGLMDYKSENGRDYYMVQWDAEKRAENIQLILNQKEAHARQLIQQTEDLADIIDIVKNTKLDFNPEKIGA